MKRALADVLFLLGATAVVFFAFAVLFIVLKNQNAAVLDHSYLLRACSFAAEFVKQDQQAITSFGLFVGLVVVIMARLSCHLPRSHWEPAQDFSRSRRAGAPNRKSRRQAISTDSFSAQRS